MRKQIEDLVASLDIGELRSHAWLGSGFASHAYQIDTSSGSYVLLARKPGEGNPRDYKAHFAHLRCLEKCGYTHAPKAVYVSDDGEQLLITKVVGTESDKLHNTMSHDLQTIGNNLVDALLELQTIRISDMQPEYEAVGLTLPKPLNEASDWQTYVVERFYPYVEQAPADAQSTWLEQQISQHQPFQGTSDRVYFRHGDTSAANILVHDDQAITLIDWTESKFYQSPVGREEYGLAYVANNAPFTKDILPEMIRYAAEKQQLDHNAFRTLMIEKRRDIKIADICWAYMMYTRASHTKTADPPETFKQILDTRIAEFKELFG